MNAQAIVALLQSRLSALLAVYAFGSRVQGNHRPQSDLDLAVLVAGRVDAVPLWHLADELHTVAGCAVDLLDLRAASTVMQYQVITTGERWWARDVQAAIFEAMVLSEKTELDVRRAPLLAEIQATGSVHGG